MYNFDNARVCIYNLKCYKSFAILKDTINEAKMEAARIMKSKQNAQTKHTKFLTGCLAAITLISVSLCAFVLISNRRVKPIMPDYMPVEQDEFVFTIPNEPQEVPIDVPENGGGAIIICDTEITAHLQTGEIDMFYQNPANSPSAVVLQLVVADEIVAQSGSIYPGYQLQDMHLLDTARLQEGGYYGVVRIAYYDPISSEKALIDTDIEVSVTVVP